jgi:NUMOD4 motif
VTVEIWREIQNFEHYSISNLGNVRAEKSGRIMELNQNQFGVVFVGLMRGGMQYHRSVPLLVANAFIPRKFEPYDTPINLNGDRWDNRVENIVWRPRWFAIRYNQQFRNPYMFPILDPVKEIKSGEIHENSFEAAMKYGLLESDLVLSILNHTVVWPTYQEFEIVLD